MDLKNPGADEASQNQADANQADASQVQDNESQEWDAALKERYPELNTQETTEDESKQQQETAQTTTTTTENPVDKKQDESEGNGDDSKKKDGDDSEAEGAKSNPERDTRNAARSYAKEVETTAADVRKQMYPDLKDTLVDGDGDAINSVEDVMKLINPATNEVFTKEEAGEWLTSAQNQFNRQLETIDKQVVKIAELNLDLKDQADVVKEKYGAYLKEHPEFSDKLWLHFESTLVKDEKTGVIIDAKASMEEFYDLALSELIKKDTTVTQTTTSSTTDTTTVAPAADAAAQSEEAKRQRRAERSDIYTPTNDGGPKDEDQDEWDKAHVAVFGNRLNK